jgi:hypothetical protein
MSKHHRPRWVKAACFEVVDGMRTVPHLSSDRHGWSEPFSRKGHFKPQGVSYGHRRFDASSRNPRHPVIPTPIASACSQRGAHISLALLIRMTFRPDARLRSM